MKSPLQNEPLNSLDQHRVSFTKDAFQSSLRSGRQPRIEDFLSYVPDELQSALLPELLHIEIVSRHNAGEIVSAAEYEARFPDCAEMIAALLKQSSPQENAPSSEEIAQVRESATFFGRPSARKFTNRRAASLA